MNQRDFEELINKYIDADISKKELYLISDELENDCAKKEVFNNYCFLHSALRKSMGKIAMFLPLPDSKKKRRKNAIFAGLEWTAILLCISVSSYIVYKMKKDDSHMQKEAKNFFIQARAPQKLPYQRGVTIVSDDNKVFTQNISIKP